MSLEARSVSVTLGRREVLSKVDLSIDRGEVVALVGPNGAGKSTLLRALAGELAPSSGSVTIDGHDAHALGELELAKLRAVVSQRSEVAFDFNALDVVLWGRAPHAAIETPACRATAKRALAAVGLERFENTPVSAMSGGEQQRVHVARALTQIGFGETGRYLLLDEPTSNLDPAQKQLLVGIVQELRKKEVGVLIVLHDVSLAAWLCDRVALMKSGSMLVAAGTPRDVLTPETLREVFEVEAAVDPSPWDPKMVRITFRAGPPA
ncbi:MAG: heme ABC transporter ATP-binding protein [Polyangiaceae bacterium]|nr:heme ABC transporter ATP-binding protein [Polyangiaceae bacterium]